MTRPPWFKEFASKFRSDAIVRKMSLSDVGVRTHLRAASWDCDEPGTLPADNREIGKITGIDPRIIRRFRTKYPELYSESDGKLHDLELVEQARKYREISEERSKAGKSGGKKRQAIAKQMPPEEEVEAELEGDGCSLMQFPQDQPESKLQERTPPPFESKTAIRKALRGMNFNEAGDPIRAHLEAGIFRTEIGEAYYDATQAGMSPEDCVREAVSVGALTLMMNRGLELQYLNEEELAISAWEQIRPSVAALCLVQDFETRTLHVIAVVTRVLTGIALEHVAASADRLG
jgi:hypothetical protein